jgi:hypothetical protein
MIFSVDTLRISRPRHVANRLTEVLRGYGASVFQVCAARAASALAVSSGYANRLAAWNAIRRLAPHSRLRPTAEIKVGSGPTFGPGQFLALVGTRRGIVKRRARANVEATVAWTSVGAWLADPTERIGRDKRWRFSAFATTPRLNTRVRRPGTGRPCEPPRARRSELVSTTRDRQKRRESYSHSTHSNHSPPVAQAPALFRNGYAALAGVY